MNCACCEIELTPDGWPVVCPRCGFVAHAVDDTPSRWNICWHLAGREPPADPQPAEDVFAGDDLPCAARQATGEAERCDLCGMRAASVPLFHCRQFQETVTVRRHRSTPGDNYRTCLLCEERKP